MAIRFVSVVCVEGGGERLTRAVLMRCLVCRGGFATHQSIESEEIHYQRQSVSCADGARKGMDNSCSGNCSIY